jgi:organic hydroperoxide reductase OsmC/OhrA
MSSSVIMSEYTATIRWQRQTAETFVDNQYSRGHQWLFDGGVTVPASASPYVVPLPYSVEANVDPEEAFVASLSSCHMLFFLSIAAKKRLIVDQYIDDAIGFIEAGENAKQWMSRVILRPKITFSGDRRPDREKLQKIHHLAHAECFIANSVKTEVITEIIEV